MIDPCNFHSPEKRVNPRMGVTATLDSIRIAGSEIPVGLSSFMLYPFPACTGNFIPTVCISFCVHAPEAITTSSAEKSPWSVTNPTIFFLWFLIQVQPCFCSIQHYY